MKAYLPLLSLVILQLSVGSGNKDDKNQHICSSSAPVVFTIDSVSYLIPNVITPKCDGINDKFCIAGLNNLWVKSLVLKPIDLEDTSDNYRLVCREIYIPADSVRLPRGPGPFGSFRYEMEIEHLSGITKILSGTSTLLIARMACLMEIYGIVYSPRSSILILDLTRRFPVEKTVDKPVFDEKSIFGI